MVGQPAEKRKEGGKEGGREAGREGGRKGKHVPVAALQNTTAPVRRGRRPKI